MFFTYVSPTNPIDNKALLATKYKATKEIISDQEECGIDILTDGEVRRENYIHYHCRYLEGIDFANLSEKIAGRRR